MRKILPYIILNLVVSAGAMLLVLVIWEKTRQPVEPQDASSLIVATLPVMPTTTQPPLDAETIEIQAAIGAGDIETERVRLVSVSSDPVNLQGWSLRDGKTMVYVFPSITLFPGGGINVYSKAGIDSSVELYMSQTEAAWRSGRTIGLYDTAGNKRGTYPVP